jgi:5-methylcytosine-specific restriction enzyme A
MPTLNKPKKQTTKSNNTKERQAIYSTSKWRKLRLAKLVTSPLCEMCLAKDIIKVGEDIHHIDSFMNYEGLKRLDKAFNYDNLQSLCKECHQRLHNTNNNNTIN